LKWLEAALALTTYRIKMGKFPDTPPCPLLFDRSNSLSGRGIQRFFPDTPFCPKCPKSVFFGVFEVFLGFVRRENVFFCATPKRDDPWHKKKRYRTGSKKITQKVNLC
jgi:hypothetical protein